MINFFVIISWIGVDEASNGGVGQQLNHQHRIDDDEDTEELKAEEFENSYNFRFEQPGSNEIVSHARNVQEIEKERW